MLGEANPQAALRYRLRNIPVLLQKTSEVLYAARSFQFLSSSVGVADRHPAALEARIKQFIDGGWIEERADVQLS
jgi:hypothetical protein